uniref:SCAN box domain-containing protein n=1 Tax=Cyprinus carpio carpio TaxID=630221 RepID=A0A9J8C922_CYPCA
MSWSLKVLQRHGQIWVSLAVILVLPLNNKKSLYELVPEAYRLRFRNWKKGEKQTYTELVRELNCHFNRWCVAVGVSTFEELCNLIVLEQFRNILPVRIAIYINERKEKTAADATVLSDEYVLTHRQNFKEYNPGRGYREQRIGLLLTCWSM